MNSPGWSLLTAGVGFLLLAGARGPVVVGVMVLTVSTLADSFRPAVMAGVAAASSDDNRTRSFALLRLAANLGMAIGPAAGGFLAAYSYTWLFAGDAVTSWAAALVLWVWLGRLERREAMSAPTRGGPSPWRDGPFVALLGLVFALACTFFQIFSTLPLYLRDSFSLPESRIGALLALNALLIVVFEMLILRSVERFAALRVAAVGALLVGLGLALMPLGSGLPFAALTVVVWTVGEMLSLPLINAAVAHRAAPGSRGRAMGAYSLAYGVAFVVAPAAGTAIYEHLGATVLWVMVGVVGGLVGLGFALLSRHFERAQ